MSIGHKIKELRKKQKMTLTELSKQSGVQIATLSRIENGKMKGTIDSHLEIARSLGVDVTTLYKDLAEESQAERTSPPDASTETFSYNDKASYEILTSNLLSKKMMPVVLRVDPLGRTNAESNPAGSEKFIFVLEGEIRANVGERVYNLSPNKTMYFDASVRHWFENTSSKTAKFIAVVTPVAL